VVRGGRVLGIERDLNFDEKALPIGQVRFRGNETGREQAHYYGETICIADGRTATATRNTATPQVQLLVAGSPAFTCLLTPDQTAAHDRTRGVARAALDQTGPWSCQSTVSSPPSPSPSSSLSSRECVRSNST
jgi:hypothetical protein